MTSTSIKLNLKNDQGIQTYPREISSDSLDAAENYCAC